MDTNTSTNQCESVEIFVEHLSNVKRESVVPHEGPVEFASTAGGTEKCLAVVGTEDAVVALLPSADTSYLWNTAMLNGVQVTSKIILSGLTRDNNVVMMSECECTSATDNVVQVHSNCSSPSAVQTCDGMKLSLLSSKSMIYTMR